MDVPLAAGTQRFAGCRGGIKYGGCMVDEGGKSTCDNQPDKSLEDADV